MRCKAVIFDLDGTLLNSLEDIADSVNASLKILGLPAHPLESYKLMVGDGRDVLAERALPERYRDPETHKRLMDLINKEYTSRWADKTSPYDGIPGILDVLTSRKIKLAVLSNKDHVFTEMMVSKVLPGWRFDAVVGISASVSKKPDPGAAIRIARGFGLQPSEFIFLGDTDVDMRTAVNAGMYPVGALWGFRTREELIKGGASAVIEYPEHLLSLIQ